MFRRSTFYTSKVLPKIVVTVYCLLCVCVYMYVCIMYVLCMYVCTMYVRMYVGLPKISGNLTIKKVPYLNS